MRKVLIVVAVVAIFVIAGLGAVLLLNKTPAPDNSTKFEVTGIQLNRNDILANHMVNVTVIVKNIGNHPGFYNDSIMLDSVSCHSISVELVPGEQATVKCNVTSSMIGNHLIEAGKANASFVVHDRRVVGEYANWTMTGYSTTVGQISAMMTDTITSVGPDSYTDSVSFTGYPVAPTSSVHNYTSVFKILEYENAEYLGTAKASTCYGLMDLAHYRLTSGNEVDDYYIEKNSGVTVIQVVTIDPTSVVTYTLSGTNAEWLKDLGK
ncbi:MAG TPA: hypothetical protein VGK23_08640 [Methanomassiliicoccales archaeon]